MQVLIPRSPLIHTSQFSLFAYHCSFLTIHHSFLYSHASLRHPLILALPFSTAHTSLFSSHSPLLSLCFSLRTSQYSFLTDHFLFLTLHHLLFTAFVSEEWHYSLPNSLLSFLSLLLAHHSALLTSHCLLVNAQHSVITARALLTCLTDHISFLTACTLNYVLVISHSLFQLLTLHCSLLHPDHLEVCMIVFFFE